MQDANTVYDQDKPWASLREHEVSGYLKEQTTLPIGSIEALKPPIRNIGRLIPRFGHGDYTQPTIQDVLRCDKRWAPTRVDYTGSQAGYAGTSYPTLGVM